MDLASQMASRLVSGGPALAVAVTAERAQCVPVAVPCRRGRPAPPRGEPPGHGVPAELGEVAVFAEFSSQGTQRRSVDAAGAGWLGMIERCQVGGGRVAKREGPAAGTGLVNGAHDPALGSIAEKLPESGRRCGAFSQDSMQLTAESTYLSAITAPCWP
jgi:hypothetical protein